MYFNKWLMCVMLVTVGLLSFGVSEAATSKEYIRSPSDVHGRSGMTFDLPDDFQLVGTYFNEELEMMQYFYLSDDGAEEGILIAITMGGREALTEMTMRMHSGEPLHDDMNNYSGEASAYQRFIEVHQPDQEWQMLNQGPMITSKEVSMWRATTFVSTDGSWFNPWASNNSTLRSTYAIIDDRTDFLISVDVIAEEQVYELYLKEIEDIINSIQILK